jgi:hypothetical protein
VSIDLTDTIVPKSDQLNGDDLISGPRVFTIAEVHKTGSDEQPFAITLGEFPKDRPFKPSKTVRRILVTAWGPDAAMYVGRRMRLYRDPAVKFGGQAVGGIRVSHLSHIEKRFVVALNETRGKKASHTIEPLPDDAPSSAPVSETDVKIAALQTEWHTADPERQAAIVAEVETLRADADYVAAVTGEPNAE